MKNTLFLLAALLFSLNAFNQNIFSVKGNKTLFNGEEFQVIGLRCSNALITDESVDALISYLEEYKSYGINTVSAYFMGSRYSDVNGFNLDATIKETYKNRMAHIIEACDKLDMVVLVGVLYWGGTSTDQWNTYYKGWGQRDVNNAIKNTMKFLKENNYKNVFVDPDNEGMAHRQMKFSIKEMIDEAKTIDSEIPVAYNMHGPPSSNADLSIHFGNETINIPYIETEGTPTDYWGPFSKEKGLSHYINVGMYTEGKKAEQIKRTKELLDKGHGYMFASTWLQNVPPNFHVGGDGSPCNPGIKWWLEFIKENYK